MYNKVTLIGRTAQDLVLQETKNNRHYLRFNLAVSRRKINDQRISDFIPVVLWGELAAAIAKNSLKGTLLVVEGELRTSTYQNQQGQTIKAFEVHSNYAWILENKNQIEARKRASSYNQLSNQYGNQYAGVPYPNQSGFQHDPFHQSIQQNEILGQPSNVGMAFSDVSYNIQNSNTITPNEISPVNSDQAAEYPTNGNFDDDDEFMNIIENIEDITK
ncbi:single-stranded DNA-binding protein [Mycoplasma corogypsi]|uniref:single-stranded DNA-binding protein n=1 Tax=Mycoplasma corogypsi TaxID=2106 RepID=UPI003873CB9A